MQRLDAISNPFVIRTLGFGFNRFVSMLVYGMLARIINTSPENFSYLLVSIASVFGAVCFLCLLGIVAKRKDFAAFGFVFTLSCAMCIGVGLVFVLWLRSQEISADYALIWFGVGTLLISIGSAGLFFRWGAVFARNGDRAIMLEIGIGFFIALVMLVPYNVLPSFVQGPLLIFACAADAFFLILSKKCTVDKEEDPKSIGDVDAKWIRRKMYAGMACYGIAMGLSSSLLGHTGQAVYLNESTVRLLCGTVLLVVSVIVVRFSKREPVLLLYRLAYLIIALNVVVLILLPSNSQLLLAALFVGHLLILAICMFLLFRTAHYMPDDRERIVTFGVAAFLSGDLLTRGVHDLLAATNIVSSSTLSFAFTLALIVVVIVAYAVVFSERDIEKMEVLEKPGNSGSFDQTGPPAASFESYADIALARYGLTPREFEIVSLLLLGRSSPRIQGELFISESTVHTHIRHIYAKMSIHSRQELIDLAKQWREESSL